MPSSSSTWIWPTGGEPESGFEGILPMLLLKRGRADCPQADPERRQGHRTPYIAFTHE